MLDDTLEAAADKYATLFSLVLTVVVILSTLFTLLLLTLPGQYDPYKDKSLKFVDEHGIEIKATTKDGKEPPRWKNARSVQVVVLGDIGRSPRMQYHALSLAKHGARVTLIGYQGEPYLQVPILPATNRISESEILPEIVSNPLIDIIPLSPAPASLRSSSKLLFPILAPLKVLWQIFSLYTALGYRSQPTRWTLVQNPPSIPTLAVASLVCFLRRTDLVIDWHNFGYSILAMKLGDSHPLVRISEKYEKIFAKAASHHITVTDAMARVLKVDYGVTAQALHDRPASAFQPIGTEERAKFLKRLPETAQFAKDLSPSSKTPWKLIVSATSWTADEDFSLLLSALVAYSAECTSKTHLPRILAIITGKGPQRDYYLSKVRELNQQKKLQNVIIRTAWLTHADYALLLASADLGVSLHTSSSGVDLPMKVVDMFGAGLPVVGWGKFEAWPELVKQGVNGLGFQSPEELALHLAAFFGSDGRLRETLKVGALKESEHRWDDEWDSVGGKLFKLI